MNNIKELLGKKIRELRKARNLTQEQLAEKIGIGTPNISYIETGKFAPSMDNIQKIAEVLDVDIYELYMFNPLKSSEEIRKELIDAIEKDDSLLRLLYKFFITVK